MTDIQRELLSISKIFINLCDKLGLKYFAIGGTLLGAIRHHGFIPWDDDMDFGMPREDYEKLIRLGNKYISKGFFVQSYKTEKEWLVPFAKIRSSNTTAVEEPFKNLKVNHGLWIDVFPVDGLPSSKQRNRFLDYIDVQFLRRRYMPNFYDSNRKRAKFANFIVKILLPSKKIAFLLSQHNSRKFKLSKCKYFWWNWYLRRTPRFLSANLEKIISVNFEDIEINIPSSYNEILTTQYGNWIELPPVSERKTNHNFVLLDLKKSYLKLSENGGNK